MPHMFLTARAVRTSLSAAAAALSSPSAASPAVAAALSAQLEEIAQRQCQPILMDASAHIADHVMVIMMGFVEQSQVWLTIRAIFEFTRNTLFMLWIQYSTVLVYIIVSLDSLQLIILITTCAGICSSHVIVVPCVHPLPGAVALVFYCTSHCMYLISIESNECCSARGWSIIVCTVHKYEYYSHSYIISLNMLVYSVI